MIFLTFFDNMDKMPFTIWLRDVIHIISQLVCSPGHDMRAVCVPETTRLDLCWRWSLALSCCAASPDNGTRQCRLDPSMQIGARVGRGRPGGASAGASARLPGVLPRIRSLALSRSLRLRKSLKSADISGSVSSEFIEKFENKFRQDL